jgi:RNA polymerase-binding transcription factor DksA
MIIEGVPLMSNTDPIRQRLTERLAALSARVTNIEADMQQPLDDDFAEQAVDREDDEALDAVERAILREIAQTREALARLDLGTYGKCTSCGGPIAPERLKAIPTAAQCIGCASSGGVDN